MDASSKMMAGLNDAYMIGMEKYIIEKSEILRDDEERKLNQKQEVLARLNQKIQENERKR
jgi:hypothetical protein